MYTSDDRNIHSVDEVGSSALLSFMFTLNLCESKWENLAFRCTYTLLLLLFFFTLIKHLFAMP